VTEGQEVIERNILSVEGKPTTPVLAQACMCVFFSL
jgi:hypothetical protein